MRTRVVGNHEREKGKNPERNKRVAMGKAQWRKRGNDMVETSSKGNPKLCGSSFVTREVPIL